MDYKTLEPSSLSSLGVSAPSFKAGETTSLFATSSFLYSLFFTAIVIAAFYRYILAGALRMQANEQSIRLSNEIIKKVTLGLLGVFSLFLLLVTVNKGLVSGGVGLGGLRTVGSNSFSSGSAVTRSVSSGTSRACDSTESTLTKLQSSGGICGGTACTILSGCFYKNYTSIIEQATGGDSTLTKLTIVTMCKESRGKPQATNQNPNGSYDCGLMQINQATPCEQNPSQASQEANIRAGVAKIRETLSTASRYGVVPGVPAEGSAFASYNCCSNGTKPAAPSADCTPSNGFPANFPKWACPINPGEGTYNMCSVRGYACELTACLGLL
jgi:Transglycosylase SLT domain